MAKIFISFSSVPTLPSQQPPSRETLAGAVILSPPAVLRHEAAFRTMRRRTWRRRGEAVVVNAGAPSTTSLVTAFVLPLSLIVGTIFASIRIADRLDEQFLEDLAMNQAILEEREGDGEEVIEEEEEVEERAREREKVAATPRVRNRPRREA